MKREYCQRNFNGNRATITYDGKICIVDDWHANWGIIYTHIIKNYKEGVISAATGFKVQVIGMDFNPQKKIANWIYEKIDKGYFDHLIE